YVELNDLSTERNTPVSQIAVDMFRQYFANAATNSLVALPKGRKVGPINREEVPLGRHGTFSPNSMESIHRWYPYIEGFSSTFVRNLISKWGPEAKSIYDPFGGTGTTVTVGA